MKKLLTISVLVGMVLSLSSAAFATVTTFTFNPNEWLNSYSTDITQTRIQQDSPRVLIDGVSQATDAVPGLGTGTHTTYAGASYSSTGIDGFVSQVPTVEIHEFNMWLADGINAPSWGEVMTQVLGGTDPSGTASNGWAAYVFDNPWPQAGVGTKLVGWYDVGYWDNDSTTDANPLLFGQSNFDDFTLTVDLNTTDVNGNSVDLSVGAEQRIWLGTMLPEVWTSSPDDLVYSGNRRYEGTMQMSVITPVPAPGAILLGGMGVSLVGWLRRRRSL